MLLSLKWRCATCGHESVAAPGFCARCGARTGPPTLAEWWNREHPDDPMLAAPRGRSELGVTATRAPSRGISGGAGQRPWAPAAFGSVLAGILFGVALWVTGAFGSGQTHSSTPHSAATNSRSVRRPHPTAPESTPQRKPLAAADRLGAHRVFAGRAFSIAYPRGWTVKAAEAPTPWGTDTTIIAADDPHTMVRVDVVRSPATSDPSTVATPVIAGVAGEPGYRALGLTSGTFDRRPAALWEFLVAEAGVMVHKQDVFFTPHAGTVIALLTSAPADAYQRLQARFTALRRSLLVH